MDEQRRETDFNMLRVLLDNTRDLGTELILSADSDLIDYGLVQALYLAVPSMTQEGLLTAARFLQSVIAPLEVALDNAKGATPEQYLTFLGAVLQAVALNPDPQEVHPLLSANLDKLDYYFAQLLRSWATAILPEADPVQARRVAAQIGNLSIIIGRFPLGSRANNLEIEIAGYEVVATVFTREGFPEQWATLQNNLGNAYSDRLQGERAQNLEQAIACFDNALQVRIPQEYPEQWATLQNNLGNAYSDRLQGDQAENLEQAIACYHNALQVRTRDTFPREWATTQNNLGRAYSRRLKGERAQNLELALACYQSALQVYNRKSYPRRWATTQNNLANAYSDRLKGDRAENLEQAIECYQRALQVRTREAMPVQWATTQNNLGRAFSDRLRGDKADNLEAAIACFRRALTIHSRRRSADRWAAIQTHLGRTYSQRLKGERAKNLEMAIACYQKALQIYTRNKYPERWAMVQTYLGRALSEHLQGDKAMNLSSAIACYENALQVYTRHQSPERWAMLQIYQGRAFCDRYSALTQGQPGSGGRAENLVLGISCYQNALEVYDREANPHNYAKTLFYLGLAYQAQGNLDEAYKAFAAAIGTVEFLRGKVSPAVTSQFTPTSNQLYKSAVAVCLELAAKDSQYAAQAWEWVERHKAYSLVELLTNCHLYPHAEVPQAVRDELELLRQEMATEQQRLEKVARTGAIASPLGTEDREEVTTSSSIPFNSDNSRLHQLQQSVEELIAHKIESVDPYFSLTQTVQPLAFEQIQELLPENTAMIAWASLGEMLLTFTLLPHAQHPLVHLSSPEKAEALEEWASEYITAYSEQKGRWVNQLTARLARVAELLEIDRIVAGIPADCEQLILIPHRFLHLLPFHALPLGVAAASEQSPSYLIDRFPRGVRYAPSCQLLRLSHMGGRMLRGTQPLRRLLAVHNSTKDLIYSHLEANYIARYFASAEVFGKKNAIKDALYLTMNWKEQAEGQPLREQLQQGTCAHFACQGLWNFEKPLQSAISLGSESLTLKEIFNVDFRPYRLVTLSACETVLGDASLMSDYISFSAGLLGAGTPSIVSSLWKVSDISTLLLMSKFYENLCQLPRLLVGDVAHALNEAQKWLRDLTSDEFEFLLHDLKSPLAQIFAQLPQGPRLIAEASLQQTRNRKPCPFASPYHWAAFTAVGI